MVRSDYRATDSNLTQRSTVDATKGHTLNAAKTTTERVAAMRTARTALGLKRLELYAHPDDHQRIKEFAAKLAGKRVAKAPKGKA